VTKIGVVVNNVRKRLKLTAVALRVDVSASSALDIATSLVEQWKQVVRQH
jgi:hypothetical protein